MSSTTLATDPNSPNATNFLTTIARYGLAKLYKFKILDISPLPDGVKFPFNPGNYLNINALSIPSRRINTAAVSYKAFEYNIPTNVAYPENQSWSITVNTDSNQLVKKFFEDWSEAVYSLQSETGQFVDTKIQFAIYEDEPGANQASNTDGRRATFTQVNQRLTRIYTLHGAYPNLVGGMQYSYSDPGKSFASFNVTFSFQWFEAKEGSPALPASNNSSNSSTQATQTGSSSTGAAIGVGDGIEPQP